MRLKLSTLVVAGLAASALIAAVLAATGAASLARISAAQRAYTEHVVPSTAAWAKANDRRTAVARYLNGLFMGAAILDERIRFQEDLRTAIEELAEARRAYVAHPHDEKALASWTDMGTSVERWLERVRAAAKSAEERDRLLAQGLARTDQQVVDAAAEAWTSWQEAQQAVGAVDQAQAAMEPELEHESAEAAEEIQRVVQAGIVRLTAVAAIAALVALAIGLWVRRKLLAELGAVQGEVGTLTAAARAGRLSVRAAPGSVGPDFRGIVSAVNETVDAFQKPIAAAAGNLTRIARGDVPAPITETYEGDFDTIKQALNGCIGTVNALVTDTGLLVEAAAAGRLTVRADASKHHGDFRRIVQGVNDTLDAVTGPLAAAAQAVDGIARGAIPPRITADWRGDFDVLKHNLNGCIDAVNALVSDVNGLSAAAVEGRLSVRADASKHQGDFRRIVQGVNGTLDAVTVPLGAAAQVVDDIARGAIPPRITADWRGDFDLLKRNLNTCLDAVDALVLDADALAVAAVEGRLRTRADAGRHQGDFRKIVEGFNRTLDAVLAPVSESARALEALAQRDLRVRVQGEYRGEHAEIKDSLNATAEALEAALVQVAAAARQVSSASTQIAASSQAVAAGASEQAASLEQTTSAVESVSAMTRHATESAQQANALAQAARAAATEGAASVTQMTSVMDRIRASAEGTSQIIKDVSDIAFQTNLLALNAAVEAARAGEAGRGFAVVAEEVRSLALRAKEAATKTEELIRQSVKEAGEGEVTARHVAGKLAEIVGGIGKVGDIVSEIATSSREQARGIDGVTRSVTEMEKVTQQNAASAEESSSAASELSSQAEELGAMIATFRLTSQERPARARRELHPAGHGNGANGKLGVLDF